MPPKQGSLDSSDQDEPVKSKEQTVFADRLKGQTIDAATIESDADGGKVSLTLVGSQIPASIEWNNSGHVAFKFKNISYLIQK